MIQSNSHGFRKYGDISIFLRKEWHMAVNDHTILSQQEIDNLIAQLAKATEKSYNEGFNAANEAIVSSGDNPDYTTGYNQGVKIGYEIW